MAQAIQRADREAVAVVSAAAEVETEFQQGRVLAQAGVAVEIVVEPEEVEMEGLDRPILSQISPAQEGAERSLEFRVPKLEVLMPQFLRKRAEREGQEVSLTAPAPAGVVDRLPLFLPLLPIMEAASMVLMLSTLGPLERVLGARVAMASALNILMGSGVQEAEGMAVVPVMEQGAVAVD